MNDNYIQKVHIDWDIIPKDSYLRNIAALKHLEDFSFNNRITFFVGENGTGKSTLLEAIAVAYGFNPEGGTINYSNFAHKFYLCTLKIQYLASIQLSMFSKLCRLQLRF